MINPILSQMLDERVELEQLLPQIKLLCHRLIAGLMVSFNESSLPLPDLSSFQIKCQDKRPGS